MTQMDHVKVGLFLAVLKHHVGLEESTCACLGSEVPGSSTRFLSPAPAANSPRLRKPDLEQLRGVTATRE